MMFLRVCRGGHDSVYECNRMHVHPSEPSQKGTDRFWIDLERDDTHDSVTIEIDKAVPDALGVYLMNDAGRTIDTIFRKDANAS